MSSPSLYQWCEYCKDEKVFDYKTVTCKTCKNKSKNFIERKNGK